MQDTQVPTNCPWKVAVPKNLKPTLGRGRTDEWEHSWNFM